MISQTGHKRNSQMVADSFMAIIVVAAVATATALLLLPRFGSNPGGARVTAAHIQISTFGIALDAYREDLGEFPQGRSLSSLVLQPTNSDKWNGPYLKELSNDPWGRPFLYECPGKHNASSYDLMSMGPDGRIGGDDDITNWKQN